MNENLQETFSGLAFNFTLPSLEHNEPLKNQITKRELTEIIAQVEQR